MCMNGGNVAQGKRDGSKGQRKVSGYCEAKGERMKVKVSKEGKMGHNVNKKW